MNKLAAAFVFVFAVVIGLAGRPTSPVPQQEQKTEQTTPEQPPPEPTIPEEERTRKNPIPPNQESLEMGRKIFSSQCVMCHGEKGDGKGDLAVEDNLTVPDFTSPDVQKKRTDGELFHILKTGHGLMPAQGKRLRDEQRWNLINYIRALPKGGKAAEEKKE